MERQANIWLLTHEPFWPPSGGGSTEAVYLVRALIEQGHTLRVFAPGSKQSLPKWLSREQDDSRFAFFPFRLWKMSRYGLGRLFRYALYPLGLYGFILTTWRMARLDAPDLIISQHVLCAPVALWLRRRWNCMVVLNELDLLTGYLDAWPRYLVPPPVARKLQSVELLLPIRTGIDGLLVVSDALRDRFIRQGMNPQRVRTIYYGFDSALFRLDDPVEMDRWRVVVHGSFDRHHLGRIALEGLVCLLRRLSHVRVRFIGRMTGRLRWLVQALNRHGFGSRVEHTGFVPYEQVPELIAGSALGLVPYEPSEGSHCAFVAKAVEYLAMGIPVVSTKLEGLFRYFGENPMIHFTPFDGEAFGEACVQWLQRSPELRERFALEVSRQVHKELSWGSVIGRAIEFLNQLLSTRGS